MTGRLAGKTAWVTGAGSGIGRAVALAFAAEGCRLALTGRRTAPLEETASLSGRDDGVVVPADLTDDEQIAAAAARVAAELGGPDILVNNAGINLPKRHWHQVGREEVRHVLDANLTAPFLLSLAVLPAMKARGGGLIVQVASMAGKRPSGFTGPGYIASKTGLVALSASFNLENGVHGVRSTCLCPGEVATPILDLRPEPPSAEERARMLQPEDVAAAALFVALLPPRACVDEILINPTWNRVLAPQAQAIARIP